MDQTCFGLRQRPFRSTPDTRFYYPATGSERALARILEAIADDEGLVLLTGEPGTGKSLLCHCLIERLGSEVTTVLLTNSHFRDRIGLLQAILYDLSLPYEGRGEQELRLALTDFLLKNCQAGKRTVLVIDEAQGLSPDLLEELSLFGNLEAQTSKAVQIVLAAQPSLEEMLRRPDLAAFRQRVTVQATLEPLGVHEAVDYLVCQLRTAGGRPEQIIMDDALELLARGTRGLPRLLNQTARHALALAQAGEVGIVDVEVALEALAAFDLEADEDQEPKETAMKPEELLVADDESATADNGDTATDEELADCSPGNSARRLFGPPRRSA
jgi:type II secretory pathway predicted ATPase ExeA